MGNHVSLLAMMHGHMSVKFFLKGKLKLANLAVELLLRFGRALMTLHMQLERTLPHKRLMAHIAFKWPRVRMLSLVVNEVPLRREALPAAFELAPEWFFSCVNAHVCLEVSVLREACSAHLTLEWLLSSVSSLVNFEAA